jgi:hypothetical protein
MTEQVPPTGLEEPLTDGPEGDVSTAEADIGGPTTTGVPAVDRVLEDIDRLDDVPLEEHLATFEGAHDSLREALDAPPTGDTDRETDRETGGQGSDLPTDPHPPGDPA